MTTGTRVRDTIRGGDGIIIPAEDPPMGMVRVRWSDGSESWIVPNRLEAVR